MTSKQAKGYRERLEAAVALAESYLAIFPKDGGEFTASYRKAKRECERSKADLKAFDHIYKPRFEYDLGEVQATPENTA